MADYWVSFRIDESGHPRRYDAFIQAVGEMGTGFWDGPTSFIAIRSEWPIDDLGRHLKSEIDERRDLFVLREIGRNNTRYAGNPGDGFEAFFPNAKKL